MVSRLHDDGVGLVELPEQKRKIAIRRGGRLTIMVVGESGLGKTTLINTLLNTTLLPPKSYHHRHLPQPKHPTEHVEIIKTELLENLHEDSYNDDDDDDDQFRVQLTIIDTPSRFRERVNNRECWAPIIDFIEEEYESCLRREMQPRREERDDVDMRVHVCLYFIGPGRHGLGALDIEAMKRLGTRVNLVPVIAKADTITPSELYAFKQNIREAIMSHKIRIYTPPLEVDDDPVAVAHVEMLVNAMPFAVIGSTEDVETPDGRVVKGREYPWGVVEVDNDSDVPKLRSLLIQTHMLDLISNTEKLHYENYRRSRLDVHRRGPPKDRLFADNPRFREKEAQLRENFEEMVRAEENRFRVWEKKLFDERDRLNEDLRVTHGAVKHLEKELDDMRVVYEREAVRVGRR